jgi:hypothetical protein
LAGRGRCRCVTHQFYGKHPTDRRLIFVDGGMPGSLKRRRIAGAWPAGGSGGLPPPSWRAAAHRGRRAGSQAGEVGLRIDPVAAGADEQGVEHRAAPASP